MAAFMSRPGPQIEKDNIAPTRKRSMSPPGTRSTSSRPAMCVPPDAQIGYVVKLLNFRGEDAAREIRERIRLNKGLTAKGVVFDVTVLKTALKLWAEGPGSGASTAPRENVAGVSGAANVMRTPERRRLLRQAAANAPTSPPPRPASLSGSQVETSKPPSPSTPRSPLTGKRMRLAKSRSRWSGGGSPVDVSDDEDMLASEPIAKVARTANMSRPSSSAATASSLQSRGATPTTVAANARSATATAFRAQDSEIAAEKTNYSVQLPAQAETSRLKSNAQLDAQTTDPNSSGTSTPQSSRLKRAMEGAMPSQNEKAKRANSPTEEPTSYSPEDVRRGSDSSPATDCGASGTEESGPAPKCGRSVKELKALLTSNDLDFSDCVEKADLEALWSRFEVFRSRGLAELQAACLGSGGRSFPTVEECARFLVAPMSTPSSSSFRPAAPNSGTCGLRAAEGVISPAPSSGAPSTASMSRPLPMEVDREVDRLLSLQKNAYSCTSEWGFAVLAVATRDIAAVQRAYRSIMKMLHPDKVGQSLKTTRAVEIIREAKDSCERRLSSLVAPGAPKNLRYEALCAAPGKRRFRLTWSPPDERATAPVRRYVVAAFDPAYGRTLTITILEPDYCEVRRRFVSVEELGSYELSEEELVKMPSVFKQSNITIYIAAGNEAGQSNWATVSVPTSAASAAASQIPRCQGVASQVPSGARASAGSSPSRGGGSSSEDEQMFETELRRRSGSDLRQWLGRQRKAPLVSWLRSLRLSTTGTKEELVERIIRVLDGSC
eukprot:TRINITY_DN31642_c0_g1_i1.p1 TRINITY_DN31642_c0_g1~~TRINITY_DN31642_c0_g1_i1.p1  ORF type:complete len:841 (-),score=130.94 TRINITY_DN31642_c0_g1_i1:68-2401(-)